MSNVLTNKEWRAVLDKADKLGAKAGKNAAGWYIQDTIGGRVTRGEEETAQRILEGLDEGDPEIMDELPAHSLTKDELKELIDDLDVEDLSDNDEMDIAETWERAFADAAQEEIARAAQDVLE